MNALLVNPFEFNSAALTPADAAAANSPPNLMAAAVLIPKSVEPDRLSANSAGAEFPSASVAFSSEACTSRAESLLPSREFAPDWSGVSAQERPLAISDTQYDTSDIPELLRALNEMNRHPVDLDALAANLDKIDRNSEPPQRELLTFQALDPIYYDVQKPRTPFLQRIFGSTAGVRA